MSKNRRGAVLLLTIFFLSLMFMLALTFARLLPGELNGANRERVTVQGRYASDAGVQTVMYNMQKATPILPQQGQHGELPGGWTWEISEPVTNVGDYYWVTVDARQNGMTRRRCRVVIQKGNNQTNLPAWYFPGWSNGGADQNSWDWRIKVIGDIWVAGIDNAPAWFKMQNFDSSWTGAAPINGTVYTTGRYSDSPCGAEYVLGDKPYTSGPTAVSSLYAKIYQNGISAVRPNSSLPVNFDADTVASTVQSQALGEGVLGTDPTATNLTDRLAVNYNIGATNTASGGVYLKTTSNGVNVTVGVADTFGNIIATPLYNGGTSAWNSTFDGGNSVMKVKFPSAVQHPPLVGYDNAAVTSTEWTVTEVKKGYNFPLATAVNVNGVSYPLVTPPSNIPTGTNKLIISDAAKKNFFVWDNNSNGAVYIDGDIDSIQGISKGKRTICAANNVTITGELLKSCRSPGTNGTKDDPDVLGLMKKQPDTPNAQDQLNIWITSTPSTFRSTLNQALPAPYNNTCYMYAAIAGLAKADLEDSPSANQGSKLWDGADLFLNGSLIQDSTDSTPGHLKKFFDFFGAYETSMILDPAIPPWWLPLPQPRPTLRAYVDIPLNKDN